jgi:hypothetical protein
MVKKIALWVVFAGVVGLLVFGAVNRTSAKAGGEDPRGKAGIEEENHGQNNRGESGKNNAERQETEDLHLAESEDHEWVAISGFVSALDGDSLMIKANDERLLEVSGRAWWFIQEEGFELSVGDEVALKGFFENGEYELGSIENLTAGSALSIRDVYGTPLWSGRGR